MKATNFHVKQVLENIDEKMWFFFLSLKIRYQFDVCFDIIWFDCFFASFALLRLRACDFDWPLFAYQILDDSFRSLELERKRLA